MSQAKRSSLPAVLLSTLLVLAQLPSVAHAQKPWRAATESELAALLPDRAPVEQEHIETEMRTATGITNGNGTYIAAVLLITAGYSADGKYSHFLVVNKIITDLGEFEFREGNLHLIALAPAVTVEEITAKTQAAFKTSL